MPLVQTSFGTTYGVAVSGLVRTRLGIVALGVVVSKLIGTGSATRDIVNNLLLNLLNRHP